MNRNANFNAPDSPTPTSRPWGSIIAAALLLVAVTVPFAPWLSDADIATMGASADTIPLIDSILPPVGLSFDVHAAMHHHGSDGFVLDSRAYRPHLQLAWTRQVRP